MHATELKLSNQEHRAVVKDTRKRLVVAFAPDELILAFSVVNLAGSVLVDWARRVFNQL